MKYKFLFFIVLFQMTGMFVFADIRDCVCIVRPQYDEQTIDFLKSADTKLSRFGYNNIAEYFDNTAKGVFGSGFVINENGKVLVLTNYHVAAYVSAVTLEFENADGTTLIVKDCPIIAVDKQVDLAAAEVPEGKVQSFLSFAAHDVTEDSDVWTAGYPAFGDEPLWQLGKGSVTNARARITEMADPKKSFFIQHSAPVDSGNSGGPLLQKSAKASTGYVVVGMNAAKALFRQAANFAIPMTTIKKFLSNRVFLRSKNLETSLEVSLQDFTDALSYYKAENDEEKSKEEINRIRKLVCFISDTQAMTEGLDIYLKALKSAPKNFYAEIVGTTIYGHPIDGIKTAIACKIYTTVQPSENKYTAESPIEAKNLNRKDGCYEFVLTNPDKKNASLFTLWKETYGSWDMDGLDVGTPAESASQQLKNTSGTDAANKNAKKKKMQTAIDELPFKYHINLNYTGLKNKTDGWRSSGMFGFFYTFKYTEFGLNVIAGKPRSNVKPFMLDGKPAKVAIGIEPELKILIPVKINDFYLVPKIFAGGGTFVPDPDGFLQYGLGADFIPTTINPISFGTGYIVRSYVSGAKETEMGAVISFSLRF